jgi:hypothetical protein
VCWKPLKISDGNLREFVHHLAHPNRRDVSENWLLLCHECHGSYHNHSILTPGMLLTAKHDSDVNHFSLAVICILKGWRNLPENWYPAPIPEAFQRERERNRR